MANTYTQLYVQFVFAVKGRESLIPKKHKGHVHRYITGIVENRKHKMLAINIMPDHAHIFVGLHPDQSISELAKDIKLGSNEFLNAQNWMPTKFFWQKGFGAFSYSRSQIDAVVKYVLNQEEHHRTKTFEDEYLSFLKKFEIEFDQKYVFDFFEVDYSAH